MGTARCLAAHHMAAGTRLQRVALPATRQAQSQCGKLCGSASSVIGTAQRWTHLTATPWQQYTLLSKEPAGAHSHLLRFAMPEGEQCLGMRGVKALLETQVDGEPQKIEKSYSPVSLPSDAGFFDLLVKTYPPRPGGGLGAFLCDLSAGETATLRLKPPREIHGSPDVVNRWQHVGLVAAGTGLAPLFQLARILLNDCRTLASVRLLFINRSPDDILMAEQLRDLQRQHPTRFSVVHSLTRPPADWTGLQGRGSVQMARLALPPPRRANVQQPPQAGMQHPPQAGMQQPPQAGMQAPPHGNSRHLQEPSLQNSRTGGTGIERRQATSSPNSSNASTLEASTTDRLYTNSADPEQREMHPSSLGKTMIFVCGRDGFVSTWAGPRTRSFHQDGTSLKAQGPPSGILEQSGYSAEEVYKY